MPGSKAVVLVFYRADLANLVVATVILSLLDHVASTLPDAARTGSVTLFSSVLKINRYHTVLIGLSVVRS